ncbi:MAG: aldose 1-epimerase family protein [Clostridia bacterium]|nr:aldose 1-epimerase family protein [Clostridia bacterium]
MKAWKPDVSREACVRRYGNIKQLGGLKRYVFSDGKASGVEAVDVETGGGLRFTVLPGRGMDISELRYRGVPLAYLSKTGVTAPSYHDPRDMQWLKSFFAGLLTTCGISNAGPECRDDIGILSDVPFGLHGDISNIGADNVCTREEWVDGKYQMMVSGRMEEGRLHGEHLQLRRTVTTELGANKLCVEDEFSNQGELPQKLMFFYHINLGHPLLGPGARFAAPSKRIWAESEHAKAGMDIYDKCALPQPGYLEQQFFHEMGADEDGNTICALINDELEIALYLKYNVRELPCIAEWKVLRDGEYVLAFEPGNCHPIGRIAQNERGHEILEPMQRRFSHLEIGIADGPEEIAALEEEIARRR